MKISTVCGLSPLEHRPLQLPQRWPRLAREGRRDHPIDRQLARIARNGIDVRDGHLGLAEAIERELLDFRAGKSADRRRGG